MKSVGENFPKFKKEAVLANNQFDTITNEDHKKEGKWMYKIPRLLNSHHQIDV